jgi:type I site-specific restriction endonuclease
MYVLEAKRPDLDPCDAKEQAPGYAENLRAPFVILSNGKERWLWIAVFRFGERKTLGEINTKITSATEKSCYHACQDL